MPTWSNGPTVVFRADAGNNVESASHELELGIDDFSVRQRLEGKSLESANHAMRGPKLKRYEWTLLSKDLYINEEYDDNFQLGSAYDMFVEMTALNYLWIYRFYRYGYNHAAGPFPWVNGTDGDTLYNLTTDTPSGILPIRVELMDTPSTTDTENGRFAFNCMLLAKNLHI